MRSTLSFRSTRSGVEERAASLAKRSLKKETKVQALRLAISMIDLTTLEGKDTPGKVLALCRKAILPDPLDGSIPHVGAVCVYPNMVPFVRRALERKRREDGGRRDRFSERPEPARSQARRGSSDGRDGRRRDRHGHQPVSLSHRRLPDECSTRSPR
jgi:hypothetical protein